MIRMAEESDKPHVDAILYWDIKRFARNQIDADYYMAYLRKLGYHLVSLSDNIVDNEFRHVQEAFLKWKAEKDREDIGKDSKRGLDFLVNLKHPDTGRYLGVFPQQRPATFFRIFKIGPDDPIWHRLEATGVNLRRNNGSPRVLRCIEPDPDKWEQGNAVWPCEPRERVTNRSNAN